VERAVRGLDGELAHADQVGVQLVERALRGLHEADAVARVAAGLVERADLRAHALGDAEAGRVVRSARDAQTGGQAREVPGQAIGDGRQVRLRRLRVDVGVDTESHDWFLDL